MAQTTLVEFPREAGQKLLEAADNAGLDVTAAFWMYRPEEEAWRLIVASPTTQTEGTIAVALKLRGLLDQMPDEEKDDLSLSDMVIVSPRLPLIEEIRSLYGPVASGHSLRRPTRSRAEPFVYRLEDSAN